MGSIDDIVSQFKNAVDNASQIAQAVQNAFPRINGTFTLSAGTTTVVTQPDAAASAIPWWVPTNAAAAQLVRTRGLYLSAVTAGSGFSVSTDNGTAAGTETFKYVLMNPS